jgi:hypothetical protein
VRLARALFSAGLKAVLIATVGTLLAASVVGIERVASRPDPPFLALGRISIFNEQNRDIRVGLLLANGTPNPVSAVVTIATAKGGVDVVLWTGEVRSLPQSSGTFEIPLPNACGLRLAIRLQEPSGQDRLLSFVAPCLAPGVKG